MVGIQQNPASLRPSRVAAPRVAIVEAALTDDESAWARQVGRRLRAEFSALVAALPAHERTASGVERMLGTHRAVNHRLLSALATPDDLEVLMRIPGVEGLRKMTTAAKRRLSPKTRSILTGADSALAEFQELIGRTAGSHAKLIARLRVTRDGLARSTEPDTTPPGRREGSRRAMHEVVRTLCGRSVRARTSISIIAPRRENPLEAEYVHTRAFIGYRATAGALPLVLGSWITNEDESRKLDVDYRDLSNTPIEGAAVTGTLRDFCSSPLPLVATRDTSGRLVQIVDRTNISPEVSMDAVMAYRLPSVGPVPSRLDPPIFLEAVNVSSPSEHLVADFYFHRSLLAGGTPALNLYLGRGTGGCDLIDRWYEQISGGPVLGLLGSGIANAHTNVWSRHAELTRHVFSELAWNPLNFVGFRCEEHWPLWNCDYVMSIDYRVGPSAESARE